MSEARAREIVQALIGEEAEVSIVDISRWQTNDLLADQYQKGRVFCAGDAVHRHPPPNGLGSNTSIQDAYNLSWKLAFVLKKWAGPELLDSYSQERQPIGRQIVDRANKSFAEGRGMAATWGLKPGQSKFERERALETLRAENELGEAVRSNWLKLLETREYTYSAHGVELNQFYRSGAVLSSGERGPDPDDLHYHASTLPGSHLPHCWLERSGKAISTLDLAGNESFCILTGLGGDCWLEAARTVSDQTQIPVRAHKVGLGLDITDPYGRWAALKGVRDEGCLLVRPDMFVCWRSDAASRQATEVLLRAIQAVLCLHSQRTS